MEKWRWVAFRRTGSWADVVNEVVSEESMSTSCRQRELNRQERVVLWSMNCFDKCCVVMCLGRGPLLFVWRVAGGACRMSLRHYVFVGRRALWV